MWELDEGAIYPLWAQSVYIGCRGQMKPNYTMTIEGTLDVAKKHGSHFGYLLPF